MTRRQLLLASIVCLTTGIGGFGVGLRGRQAPRPLPERWAETVEVRRVTVAGIPDGVVLYDASQIDRRGNFRCDFVASGDERLGWLACRLVVATMDEEQAWREKMECSSGHEPSSTPYPAVRPAELLVAGHDDPEMRQVPICPSALYEGCPFQPGNPIMRMCPDGDAR